LEAYRNDGLKASSFTCSLTRWRETSAGWVAVIEIDGVSGFYREFIEGVEISLG
jgi:hypothetical protein